MTKANSAGFSRAAVFRAAGQPLTLERFPIPQLESGEALVRIRCAPICGSDLHTFFGRRRSPSPSVLGHEMVGDLEETGEGGVRDYRGHPLARGDRITWSMVWSCGECFYCACGLRPKCERLMKFGHEAIAPGRELLGGMAEYCLLPVGTAIFKVPANVPDVVASAANCATATVSAVFRQAGAVAGRTVVVHGAGMLGQTACAMAAVGGAAQIVAIEPDARRREQSLRFGATTALDAASPREEIVAAVRELSAGRGADLGLEFAGYPESIELGIDLLRAGGRFVMAGASGAAAASGAIMINANSHAGVRAVIFDVSGTVLDYGSRGPVAAFVELFARHGIAVSEEDARKPMGTHKKDHIWSVLSEPSINRLWEETYGAAPTVEDLKNLYAEFTPLQTEVLPRHCDVIPGVPEVVRELRARGVKIANTTGFDTNMIVDLIRLAGEGGYTPDLWVCPDMVGKGRPAPWMAFHAAKTLDVYPMSMFVKVGDTLADIEEAHAAGMWAVSVVRHGNEVGLSREAVEGMAPDELGERVSAARARLATREPHYIIDSTADLIPVLDEVSGRIAQGERP